MNRTLKVIVLLLLLVSALSPCYAFSGFLPTEGVYIIEEKSGDVVYAQNEDTPYYPASTTKLMTALLLLENISDLNTQVICGAEVNDYGWSDSQAGFWENQPTTYQELLYGLLLPSGNDAAGIIAVNVGRVLLNNPAADKDTAQAAFVARMNSRAEELGMTKTHFMNPSGRHDPAHYTTPKDFAKVVFEAFKRPEIVQVSQTQKYVLKDSQGRPFDINNSNMCLYPTVTVPQAGASGSQAANQPATPAVQPSPYYSPYLKAGKTGTMDNNNRTFVFSSDMNGAEIIGILFDYPDSGIFLQSKNALDELSGYTLSQMDPSEMEYKFKVRNTSYLDGFTLRVKAQEPVYFFTDEARNATPSIRWAENYIDDSGEEPSLTSSISSGDKVGAVVYTAENGMIIKTVPVYAQNSLSIKTDMNTYIIPFGIIATSLVLTLAGVFFFIKLKHKKTEENGQITA